MPHVAVQCLGVGPIGLDRNDREAMMLDEMPRDRGASAVELGRAVARFAQQDYAAVREAIEQIL